MLCDLPLCLSKPEAFVSHTAVPLSLSSAVINAVRGPCFYSHTHSHTGDTARAIPQGYILILQHMDTLSKTLHVHPLSVHL